MIVRGATILLVFGLVAAACGGQAFTSAGGGDPTDGGAGSSTGGTGGSGNSGGTDSGGSSSTGGSSNTGGSHSTGGSGGSAMAGAGGQAGHGGSIGSDAGPGCPINQPTVMQSCQQEGLSCQYGKCCPTIAMCRGGSWQIALTDCAVPGCPATAPTPGASCTCVNTPVPCHYECATVAKSIDATCVNDVWSTVSSACAAVPCGASMCMPGEVCVKTTSGAGVYFKCASNPCTDRALTCNCAATLCPAGNVCGVSGATVSCTCPNCP